MNQLNCNSTQLANTKQPIKKRRRPAMIKDLNIQKTSTDGDDSNENKKVIFKLNSFDSSDSLKDLTCST